jgi:hypothetical protein
MVDTSPYRMNPGGGSPHDDNARLPAQGGVAPVVLPGEVEGMAVLGHEALKEFLAHAARPSRTAGSCCPLGVRPSNPPDVRGSVPAGWGCGCRYRSLSCRCPSN